MNVPDQRKSKRFELRLPFELVRGGSQPLNERGETMNLSSAGVLFTSRVKLEVGSPIEYFITLQGGVNAEYAIRLHCVGKVVRRHEGHATAKSSDNKNGLVAMAATLERYEFVRPSAK